MKTVDPVSSTARAPNSLMVLAAFAAIYLIWGSTYLAIKYAVESVPPFLMTAVRFAIAGAVLYLWSVVRGHRDGTTATPVDSRRDWREAFIVGGMLIVGGTALVGWAELSVPSGITSLILATNPLWLVLLEGIGNRRAPAARVMVGVTVGLVGLAILIGPSVLTPGTGINLLGAGALALSALTWSAGALYSRRLAPSGSRARTTGMQMIAGALLSFVVALALGEHRELSLADITPASLVAIGYLIVAGALVGFSAYLWLMRVSTPSRVATHAYVNPVVAVLLGWAVLGEAVTTRTAVAMVVIVLAVLVIVSAPTPMHKTPNKAVTRHRTRDEPRLAECTA